MSSTIPNLWPTDLAPLAARTPLTILKEQASQLGAATKNLLEGHVTTYTSDEPNDRLFKHRFNIVAPSLGNYTYELFQVTHKLDLYPVKVTVFTEKQIVPVEPKQLVTEGEFMDYLRDVFKSDITRRIIGALLAQVQS